MERHTQWVLPLAALLVSIVTLILNRIDNANKARREALEQLEERVRLLETQLQQSLERERALMVENLSLRRDRDADRERILTLERQRKP